jgi:hypothetical protein
MKTHDLGLDVQYFPPRSEGGVRFALDDVDFSRWWKGLPHADARAFVDVYSGDDILARFVCVLDYFDTVAQRPQDGWTIVQAYAHAARIDPSTDEAKIRAKKAWDHDSVRFLLDRLQYRARRQASARIWNKATSLLELVLTEAAEEGVEMKERTMALQTAAQFLKVVSTEEMEERRHLRRREIGATLNAPTDSGLDELSESQAAVLVRAIEMKFPGAAQKALS